MPRSLNIVLLCVPAGTLSDALPSSVGTWISPPSAAVMNDTGTSQYRLSSSRWKTECSATCITTYRSPGVPPRMPASPLREDRRRAPSSIPAGILSLMRAVCSTRPSPLHFLHGFSMIVPVPLQRGQVCDTWKNPREVMTCPRPWQVRHVTAWLPASAPVPVQTSQVASLLISISFSTPAAASSSVICRS